MPGPERSGRQTRHCVAGYASAALAAACLADAWSVSFIENRARTAPTREDPAAHFHGLRTTAVGLPNLYNAVSFLEAIRTLPMGSKSCEQPVPLSEGFGLSQRAFLRSVAEFRLCPSARP